MLEHAGKFSIRESFEINLPESSQKALILWQLSNWKVAKVVTIWTEMKYSTFKIYLMD